MMENHSKSVSDTKPAFFKGLVVGVVGVVILGGVYFMGANSSGGFSFGDSDKAVQPTVNPTVDPTPSANTVGDLKPVSKDDHIVGSANADVVLVEYSDMECPFCKRFHPTMLQLMEDYKGKVAWVYRHFPLSFHANAQKEAEASECVADLGGNDKFWKFTDAIYERTTSNGTGFALADLKPLAEEVGVDGTKFQDCLDSGKYTAKVNQDLAEGQQAGVTGTPGTVVVVKGEAKSIIPGALPIDSIKTIIDGVL